MTTTTTTTIAIALPPKVPRIEQQRTNERERATSDNGREKEKKT